MNRREFIKDIAGIAAVGSLAGCATADENDVVLPKAQEPFPKAKGGLPKFGEFRQWNMYFGRDQWTDYLPDGVRDEIYPKLESKRLPRDYFEFDEDTWRRLTDEVMIRNGINQARFTVAEGYAFPSHPELAKKGSWSFEKLNGEVRRIKGLGIEPVAGLNFSAIHDSWLQDYHLMLGTRKYYEVVKDVIRDVWEAFDHPRFFYLGWDEENASFYGKMFKYQIVRHGDFWWHDYLYTIKCVEDLGSRAITNADHCWFFDDFYKRCPKSVLLSNWFYDDDNGGFNVKSRKPGDHYRQQLEAWVKLEEAGFDQLPSITNWVGWKREKLKIGADDVPKKSVDFCRAHIDPSRLSGFVMSRHTHCTQGSFEKHAHAMDLFGAALGS